MKKTLKTLLIIVMCLIVISVKGQKAEAKEATEWTSLQDMIDQAEDGDTIVLDQDYTAAKGDTALVVKGKTITLDLNGHTLDRNRSSAADDGQAIVVSKDAEL